MPSSLLLHPHRSKVGMLLLSLPTLPAPSSPFQSLQPHLIIIVIDYTTFTSDIIKRCHNNNLDINFLLPAPQIYIINHQMPTPLAIDTGKYRYIAADAVASAIMDVNAVVTMITAVTGSAIADAVIAIAA